MKIMISSFYQIRNFSDNMVPFSTAAWDPKWYHDNIDDCHIFIDKRGIINGYKMPLLVFRFSDWNKLVDGNEECKRDCKQVPGECKFMQLYLAQLRQLNFKSIIRFFELTEEQLNRIEKKDWTFVLVVHESPKRLCAERPVLKQWFSENGYELEEFEK